MQLSNLSLAYLIRELREQLVGAYLNKLQELERGLFRFRFQSKQGARDLVVSAHLLYLTRYKFEAPPAGHGFVAFLKKKLANKRVQSLEQHALDRVAVIGFESQRLVIELFGDGNILLLDENGLIEAVYRPHEWKDRSLKKGELYKFPAARGRSPREATEADLQKALEGTDLVRGLVNGLGIAPVIAEEVCHQAGIEKEKEGKRITRENREKIIGIVRGFYGGERESVGGCFYADTETLLPFPLESLGKPTQTFPSLNDALDELVSPQLFSKEKRETGDALQQAIRREELNLEEQLAAKERFENEMRACQEKAEAIYANHGPLTELVSAVKQARAQDRLPEEIVEALQKAFATGQTPIRLLSLDPQKRRIRVEIR